MAAVGSFERSLRQCRRALALLNSPQTAPKRSFSSTTRQLKKGPLPVFVETSSAQLNGLLLKIRSNIFVPAHLNLKQQKLVYRARHAAMLEAEPLRVDIGVGSPREESVRLKHIDRTKDVPDSWKSLLHCMGLMQSSREAWENLVGLLEGFKTAKKRWSTDQMARILRMAGDAGMAHIVLEAVRRGPKTGVLLNDLGIVREAFWSARTKALLSGWEEDATKKALKYAEQMAEILEDKEHAGSRILTADDPRCQPDIIAVLLELAAVRAARHLDGKDEEGNVVKYAARLLPNIGMAVTLSEPRKPPPEYNAIYAEYEMQRWIPVLNGLRVASGILGKAMPKMLPEEITRHGSLDAWMQRYEELMDQWQTAANKVPIKEGDAKGRGRGLAWFKDFRGAG